MRRGFTLIELLLIVAIMGTMVSVGIVSWVSSRASTSVFAAARDVMAIVRRARSVALLTQKPVVVVYSNVTGADGEKMASIQLVAQSLFAAEDGKGEVRTLAGEVVTAEEEEAGTAEATEEGPNGEEPKGEASGETLEDVLSPSSIPPEILKGLCVRVATDEVDFQVDAPRRSKISIFSTADSVARSYRAEKEKGEAGEEAVDGSGEAEETETKVAFAVNGTVDPAHRIWIYAAGKDPESGLCISVDRFGEPRCEEVDAR